LGDVVASLASTIAFLPSRPGTLDRRDPQPLVDSVLAFGATPILQRTLDQDRIKVRALQTSYLAVIIVATLLTVLAPLLITVSG
jgi:hypothetical protein